MVGMKHCQMGGVSPRALSKTIAVHHHFDVDFRHGFSTAAALISL